MLDSPFGEDFFPNTQSKPSLVQSEAISSSPISCHLGEEPDTHSVTISSHVAVEQQPHLLTGSPIAFQKC